MSVTLSTYVQGDIDYVAKLNNNASIIQTAINALQAVQGQAAPTQVSLAALCAELFGTSATLIGTTSYQYAIVGTSLSFSAGVAWNPNSQTVVQSTATQLVNFASLGAATYVIQVDSSGNLTSQPSSASALYSVVWTGTAFGAITRIANVFFSAADDAAMLVSATNSTTYANLKARLEAIETKENTLATTAAPGIVQPDGVTVTISKGVISAAPALVLETSGVANAVQTKLNLVGGDNVDLVADENGDVTINAAGGGGGGASFTAPVDINTGGPSTIGLVVQGNAGVPNIAVVQVTHGNNTGVTSPLAVAFGSSNTAGNGIIAIGVGYNDFGHNGVTDSIGNTYETVFNTSGDSSLFVAVATNIEAGTNTVTFTSGGGGYIDNLIILEVSGLDTTSPFDVGSFEVSALGATTETTGIITTTAASDLLLVVGWTSFGTLSSSGGKAQLLNFAGDNGNPIALWSGLSGAAGEYSDSVNTTYNDTTITAGIFAFKPGSAAGSQSADLQEWQSSTGAVLSAVNNLGQIVLPATAGLPTNTPTEGAMAYDSTSSEVVVYDGTAWTPIAGSGSGSSSGNATEIQGVAVAATEPSEGQVLEFNGTEWTPATPTGGGGGGAAGGLFSGILNVPTLASLPLTTAFNQQTTFSATNTTLGVLLQDTAAVMSTDHLEGLVQTYPSEAFTTTALFSLAALPSEYSLVGFVVAESTTADMLVLVLRWSGSEWQICVMSYSSDTQVTSLISGYTGNFPYPFVWLRYQDNGTNFTFYVSTDGQYFQQVYTVAKASSALGSAGFGLFGVVINRPPIGTTIMSFTQTTP